MKSLSDELIAGTILQQRYEIIQKAGGGGMGTVYKATDKRIARRIVAIKEMKQDDLDQEKLEKARARFEREAAILSLVEHARLPHVYDSFEEQGRSYLVMEFIEGETLLNAIKSSRNPLPPLLVLEYAIQLCDVLNHLHTRHEPIIFRDLKPSNIMIRPDNQVALVDFGIARNFKPGQSGDTEAFGTRGYFAPEVGYAQSDARADIYSLGATLHHCLTNQVPDYAEQNKPFPSILRFVATLPKELDVLILSMVERDPAKRPATIIHVQQELQRIFTSLSADQGSFKKQGRVLRFSRQFYANATEQFSQSQQPVVSLPIVWLSQFPALLLAGLWLLLLPLEKIIRPGVVLLVAPNIRERVYDWYVRTRLRLTSTGIWTTPFLRLLAALLLGMFVFSGILYAQAGHSYYRVEAGLVFLLFTGTILVGNQLRAAIPRNILVYTGFFLAVAFLSLLISPELQPGTDGALQPVTLNLLLTSCIVVFTLIALVGSTSIKQSGSVSLPPVDVRKQWSAHFSHLAVAGLACICLLIQYTVGEQEQMIFAPPDWYPFTPVYLNLLIVALLALLGAISFLRACMTVGFTGFDRFLILLLCLLYLPAQYTFGLRELGAYLPVLPQANLVALNLVFLAIPLLLTFFTLFSLPVQFTWVGHFPLLALALCCGWLQDFLVRQEPFPLLTQSPAQVIATLPGLAPLWQVALYAMIAASLLLMRIFLFNAARTTNVGDRIALLVITIGLSMVQWVFWQKEQSLSISALNTNLLYASYLSLFLGYLVLCVVLISTAMATYSALSEQLSTYPWSRMLIAALDRTLVLGVAGISLLLLTFFGGRAGPLAYAFHLQDVTGETAITTFTGNQLYSIVLAFFSLIAFIRLRSTFGRLERLVMLLCGIVGVLLLTDASNVQRMNTFSAALLPPGGDLLLGLSLDQVIALCILMTVLCSFFWLPRMPIRSDRILLGIVFGSAACIALLNVLYPLHLFLFITLFLLLPGITVALRIEHIRRGNATSQTI